MRFTPAAGAESITDIDHIKMGADKSAPVLFSCGLRLKVDPQTNFHLTSGIH